MDYVDKLHGDGRLSDIGHSLAKGEILKVLCLWKRGTVWLYRKRDGQIACTANQSVADASSEKHGPIVVDGWYLVEKRDPAQGEVDDPHRYRISPGNEEKEKVRQMLLPLGLSSEEVELIIEANS